MSRSVEYVPGTPPALRVKSRYTLDNFGTADLDFIDVDLPRERLYGRTNLTIQVDGRDVEPVRQSAENTRERADTERIAFASAWPRHARLQLEIDYEFQSPSDAGTRITIGEQNFHLSAQGWYPLLLAPPHVLSSTPSRPEHTNYTVRVPSDFSILARGRTIKRKKSGGAMEYTLTLGKADLTPFIAAGRYNSSAAGRRSDAILWTFSPLRDDSAAAIERFSSAWHVLEDTFGPLEAKPQAPHVLEASNLRTHVYGEEAPASAAFPGGALVNPAALALGIHSDALFDLVAHSFAHNWFGQQMLFVPDAAIGMGEGLPDYATIVMEESIHGETGRQKRIQRYIREYDNALKRGKEEPMGITTMSDPRDQQRIALAKAPLFYIALEDECGEKQVRQGLAQMVSLLRGQEVDYGTLRSSLDQTCGKPLEDSFRLWLNGKGLPAAFRAHYESSQSSDDH